MSNILPPGEIKVNMGVDNKIFQENLAQTSLFTRWGEVADYLLDVLDNSYVNNALT